MLIEECEELIFSDICHQPRAQICGCHNMYQIKYHPDNEKSLYAACQHSKEPVDSFQNRKLHHQIQHIQNNMKNQIYHHLCHYAGNQADDKMRDFLCHCLINSAICQCLMDRITSRFCRFVHKGIQFSATDTIFF